LPRRSPGLYSTPQAGAIRPAAQWAHDLASLYVPQAGHNNPRLVDEVSGVEMAPFTSEAPRWDTGHAGAGINVPLNSGLQRTSGIRWQPQSHGGFQPVTIMWFGVVLSIGASGANIGGYYSAGGPRCHFYISSSGGALSLFATLRLSSDVNVSSGTTVGVNDTAVLVATMRSATDHEVGARYVTGFGGGSLTTPGAITLQTSSANAGTAAAPVAAENIGHAQPTAAGFTTNTITFLHASWTRGMTRPELVALLADPMALLDHPPPVRRYYSVPSLGSTGTLEVTEGSDSLEAGGIVEAVGALTVTEQADAIEASGQVDIFGALAETEGDDALVAAAAQVGGGVLGLLSIGEEDDALEGGGVVEAAGSLEVVENEDGLIAVAVVGAFGPFTRRPFLVLN
jgi:hypothetical protein